MKKRWSVVVVCLLVLLTGCGRAANSNRTVAPADDKMSQEGTAESETNKENKNTTGGVMNMKINLSEKYQIIESFGTSGCWWSQYVGGWDNEYKDTGRSVRDEIAMLLFDREYGIGLNSYRYNIGAGSADSGKGKYYDPHRRAQSFETAPFTYNWNKDANAVWFMRKAVELGVEEIIMFSNSPLERLTMNGTAQVTKGRKENILPENYDAFARYVMDVAEHFVEEGIPVKYISPVNEPQWEWTEGQEGCHYEPAKIPKLYRAFLTELTSRPALKDVVLSGPESGEWKGDAILYTSALLNDSVLGGYFDTIDNHSYWSDTASKVAFKRWMDVNYPEVKLRMSEWCQMVNGSDVTMDSAFELARVLQEDLTVLDVVSWQNWVGVAPGGYRDGLIYVNEGKKTLNPLKRLWGYGNYSKFIRPSYQRVEVSDSTPNEFRPVAFTGTNDEGKKELVLVVLNQSDVNKKLLLDIQGAVEYTDISVYETSESCNLDRITNEKYGVGDAVEVGKQSITTIILSEGW
ncbi:xylanase [Anaerocolumna cellulosilytica]|uniref:Xylanase n=1 Tax=Anaerocolumna cellulosilytica TaxID=433286 RepID=A0A6S6QU22_9FIRM|nr:glycoside hydrolase [Anaerocolumna cellulosilytica]MBB5197865.1 O-glycosyl hydrolase [Anaerocolumna cellulosilytica]BCJ93176.1 xylanase [Anaerocolumna cellulosilytica]